MSTAARLWPSLRSALHKSPSRSPPPAPTAGPATVQATTTATAVNGIVTFSNLFHTVANTITINFTATGLTTATSGNVVVSPAAASKLTIQTQPSATATVTAPFAQ